MSDLQLLIKKIEEFIMIIIPEGKVKVWCESCNGRGSFVSSLTEILNICEDCDGLGYIEKRISDFFEVDRAKSEG